MTVAADVDWKIACSTNNEAFFSSSSFFFESSFVNGLENQNRQKQRRVKKWSDKESLSHIWIFNIEVKRENM